MSGTLSGGLGCLCRVFECGCGSRLRPAAQKGCAGKGFRHHIQNVGFQPGHQVLTIDKTRDGGVFARKLAEVNMQSALIGALVFTLLRKGGEFCVNRTNAPAPGPSLEGLPTSSCAKRAQSWN